MKPSTSIVTMIMDRFDIDVGKVKDEEMMDLITLLVELEQERFKEKYPEIAQRVERLKAKEGA